ncbi:iron-containing alcohol dehydrogenase family protein [Paracoccus sp. (in: a-proteobacteria)]|uniref:iron-containing alcohol dehydrogenase family protein n=1 Tax=Paracoccus sp. TaxID=267 RepID=UPI002AFEEA61|nr:iron-containing alcohol dehydrogenase family protein [Paracoccus sp. (in: a-proteobacteria)]
MKTFRHTQDALRLFSGADSLSLLPAELQRLGRRRAMIFSGQSLSRMGHVDRVAEALGEGFAGSYTGVKTHSPYPAVLHAAEVLRDAQADAIIVLGGGSAVITARAASILLGEGRPLDDICTRRLDDGSYRSPRLSAPKLPLLIAPATPNSAYVKAGAGVFDPEAGERKAIFDPQTRARAIFLDPGLLQSAPRDLVVSATLDNLILAAEGLLSPKGNPLADGELIHAVHLMHRALLSWAEGADGSDLRLDLTLAGIMAGRGTDHAPAGACTALGHAIGANFDCDNAVSKAILWPHVLAFNGKAANAGLPKLARALGLADASRQAVATGFRHLFAALGLPVGLRAFGIGQNDLPVIVERAMKDWFMQGNCRRVEDAADLLPVLQAAV